LRLVLALTASPGFLSVDLDATSTFEFYAAVRDDGRFDLNFVGGLTWWLGVRYTYDLATGAVSADQKAFIDKLLEQYTMTNYNPCVLPMAVGADLASIPLPDVPDKDIQPALRLC
jgi:hypothetical protein